MRGTGTLIMISNQDTSHIHRRKTADRGGNGCSLNLTASGQIPTSTHSRATIGPTKQLQLRQEAALLENQPAIRQIQRAAITAPSSVFSLLPRGDRSQSTITASASARAQHINHQRFRWALRAPVPAVRISTITRSTALSAKVHHPRFR